jgi:CPA1 family monovalent cation:H+ antiporter
VIPHPVLIGLAVAAAVVLSAELSRRTRVPAPCYLVLAGLAVSVVPGIEAVQLPPQVSSSDFYRLFCMRRRF